MQDISSLEGSIPFCEFGKSLWHQHLDEMGKQPLYYER